MLKIDSALRSRKEAEDLQSEGSDQDSDTDNELHDSSDESRTLIELIYRYFS
jgi:hypothetical protein